MSSRSTEPGLGVHLRCSASPQTFYRCMLAFHFCCEMPGMLNMLQKGPRQGKDGFPSKMHLIFLGGGIMSSAYMN